MKTDQITMKESLYLVYAYVSISSFVLFGVSKITENLGKALDFTPIASLLIVLNMGVFISLYYYKKKHRANEKQNHF